MQNYTLLRIKLGSFPNDTLRNEKQSKSRKSAAFLNNQLFKLN